MRNLKITFFYYLVSILVLHIPIKSLGFNKKSILNSAFSYFSNQVSNFQFESFLKKPSGLIEHYILEEYFQEDRRYFSLFLSINNQLQELIVEKSFGPDSDVYAEQFKKSLIDKYQLQPILNSNVMDILSDSTKYSVAPLSKDLYQYSPSPFYLTENDLVLWKATQEWSLEWENQYALWVNQTLTTHFMSDNNIATDCADVAYSMRWIFSYIHKLPMASRLGGTRQLFTNESMKSEWVKLPTDSDWRKNKRFLAALKYILSNTYTHTLMKDSYPIAIDAEHFTPGTHHLQLAGKSGHTMLVQKVSTSPEELPITLLFSSTPKVVRDLYTTIYQNALQPKLYESGFYKIRWAQKINNSWSLEVANKIPGYSEEQFHLIPDDGAGVEPYFLFVYKKINPNFNIENVIKFGIQELVSRLQDRIKIVEEGFEYCQNHDCSPGSSGDEDWSTPSRDRRLTEVQNTMNLATDLIASQEDLVKKWKAKIKSISDETPVSIQGKNYSLRQLLNAVLYQLIQSDPRLSIEERWGLELEKGYGKNLINQLLLILEKRKKVIAEAEPCRKSASCADNSEEVKKWNTYDMDQLLNTLWTGAMRQCAINSPTECNELNHFLSNHEVATGVSALSLLKAVPAWSSNPNAKLTYRWGQQGNVLYPHSINKANSQAYFSKDHQWFNFNDQIFNTSTLQPLTFEKNEFVGPIHFNTNHFFTYSWQEDQLIVSIYQASNQKISQLPPLTCPKNKTRIWWTGPDQLSLTILCGQSITEYNITGELVRSLPVLQYIPSYRDPRFILVDTKDGVYFSDAERNAFEFIKLPFSAQDFLKNSFYITRTLNGWELQINVKINEQTYESHFLYFESNKGILIRKTGPASFDSSITQNGKYWINEENENYEIYKRDNSDHFKLVKQVKKSQGDFWGYSYTNSVVNFLSLNTTGISPPAFVLDLETLEPVTNVVCSAPDSSFIFLTDDYYSCSNDKTSELHHKSGKILFPEAGKGIVDNIIANIGSQSWIFVYRTIRNTLVGENTIVELYRIEKDQLVGPFLQHNGDFYSESEPLPGSAYDIAPLPMNSFETSNYAISKLQPNPSSFVLDALEGSLRFHNILMLPK